MLAALKSAWPLFVGLAMLMLGNGLQNSLLGIRAGQEAFTTEATGLVMACYYVGLLGGALVTHKVVGNVGHVRVFAALASAARSEEQQSELQAQTRLPYASYSVK